MERDYLEEKLRYDENLWEMEKMQSNKKRFESVLKLYSLLGLMAAFFSIVYFILVSLDIQLSQKQIMALTVAGVGLTLSVTSWALLVVRREKMSANIEKLKSMQELSEFLVKWSKIEMMSKNTLIQFKRDFNKYSIREIIEQLLIVGLINKADLLILEEAIQVRNLAVHKGEIIPKEIL
jgi:hypothetical protein